MNGKRVDVGRAGRAPSGGKSKTQKPPLSGKERALRIAIVVVAILLALVAGALAWWFTFAKAPDLDQPKQNEGVSAEDGLSEEGAPVRVGGDRKKDFYTFLVIGRDTGGGGNTDTILLAAYDIAAQKMNVMSIPRDTMVNVSWDVKKINSVYNVNGGGDKGIKALGQEIAQLVGFVPDFQVVLEWKAVGELVDALGGVNYEVPRDMYYVDPTQNLKINIKKGMQKLSGEQAMQVVRFRDGPNGYRNGDLGRIETQQSFLKAVVSQCLNITNITRIKELAKVFEENVTTNLTLNNIAWFAQKAVFGGLKTENVQFHTMPCTTGGVWSRSYGQNLSYVLPKTDDLVSMVNLYFNPYKEDLKKHELDIMTVNADGTISSSTGKVDDTKANTSLGSGAKKPTTTQKPDDTTTTTPQPDSGNSGGNGSGTTTPPKEETPQDPVTPPTTDTPDPDEGTQTPPVDTPPSTTPDPVTPPVPETTPDAA